jgi:hypothetical protein
MDLEDTVQTARAQAQALLADGARVLEEPLKRECVDYLGDLPEPPRTARGSEAQTPAARARLDQGQSLLARLWVLKEQGALGVAGLERAVLAALRLHSHAAWGRYADAEVAWVEARRAAAAALSPFRLWEPSEREQSAFERATGKSRYDPLESPRVELKLQCPFPSCGHLGRFRPGRDPEPQPLRCSSCGSAFVGWFVEALGPPTQLPGRQRFSAKTCDGERVEVILPDEADSVFALAEGDLLAFLGRARGNWIGVENLATGGRFYPRRSGPCFLASAVYGQDAPQLERFRAFRDEALLTQAAGRALVALYYRVGPALAYAVRRCSPLGRVARAALDFIDGALIARGYGGS